MMAALIRFSIRFPGAIVGLASLLVLYGLYSLYRADMDVFPEFAPTQVVIQTESPGFTAELVEALVTQPIENAIAGTVGIASMRSQSIPGLSIVTLTFHHNTDIYRNRQMIAERIATLSNRLPRNVVLNITPLTSSASTVLGFGLTSESRSLMELRTLVDWAIQPHLMAVPGVADVNIFGGDVRQLQVQIDPQKLLQYRLSLQEVLSVVRKSTGVLGAGFVENRNQRIFIRTEGQALTVEELAKMPLLHREGQTLHLGDIGQVAEGAAPPISAAAINGKPGIYLSVQGQLGARTTAVSARVEKALLELKPALAAAGVELHPQLFRPAGYIEAAIKAARSHVLIGSMLVVTVLFLFLFNVRTAFISATAIPLSLLSAIIVLDHFGIGLNVMVLGGLAIALGEVVDDAIIDSENIFRRLRENRLLPHPQPLYQVVFNASMEVRSSVVYATFIVALVFVPLLTLSGVTGKLFAPLGYAYISAILASLLVALTLTPALSYLLFSRGSLKSEDPLLIQTMKRGYAHILQCIERYHLVVVSASLFIIVLGISMLALLKSQFIPALHEGHYIMHMTAVPGTSTQESLRIGHQVTRVIREIEGVKSVAQWVGRAQGGADTFGTHYSEFEIALGPLPGEEQRRILKEIQEAVVGFPGVTFAINTFLTERIEETISGYTAPVVINIHGHDLDSLDLDAHAVAKALAQVPGAKEVLIQSPPGIPELSIRLDPDRLARWGLHPLDVLENIQAAYEGVEAAQIYQGNRTISVTVMFTPSARDDLYELGDLPIKNPDGIIVPLRNIADLKQENGRSKILHLGGKRIQSVTADIEGRDLEAFMRDVRKVIDEKVELSLGNYLSFTGAIEEQAQAHEDLIVHSLLAAAGIFFLLYLAFRRLRNLMLTFINLPFALIGGVLAVMFTGGWISIGSLVGFVTLFGITLRNSIMLVSHYQHLVEVENLPWGLETAIRGACERLPAILLTALVTALALLPVAAASGQPGSEIEGPLALVIIGGLVTSTILNLLILPTIMLHFGHFERQRLLS